MKQISGELIDLLRIHRSGVADRSDGTSWKKSHVHSAVLARWRDVWRWRATSATEEKLSFILVMMFLGWVKWEVDRQHAEAKKEPTRLMKMLMVVEWYEV